MACPPGRLCARAPTPPVGTEQNPERRVLRLGPERKGTSIVRPGMPFAEAGKRHAHPTRERAEAGSSRRRLATGDLASLEVTRASKAKSLAALKERAAEV
jgi:hypothetical protein